MNEQDDVAYEPVVVEDDVVMDEVEVEATPAVAIEPTPIVPDPVPTPEPVVEEPVAVAEPEPMPTPAPAPVVTPQVVVPARHVITDGNADPVYLASCVYMNKFNKKSLTVHHVQRRLVELGYKDAVGDRDGFYGELTFEAVKAFQKDGRLEPTGLMDATTFTKLFAGDSNVEVVIN